MKACRIMENPCGLLLCEEIEIFYYFKGDVMDANKWILTNYKWSYVDQYGHVYDGSLRWEKINVRSINGATCMRIPV